MDGNANLPGADDLPAATSEDEASPEVRVERIEQLIEDAVNLADPVQACMGAASGDLMLMQYRLCQAIDEKLQQLADSEAALFEVLPAVNTVTKLSQQVERYQQLGLKLKAGSRDC